LGPLAISTLIALIAVHQAMAAISGCAWNSWMRDLVPDEVRGRFFGRRIAANTALAMVVALAGGAVLDLWKRDVPGDPALSYTFLFTISAVLGFVGVYLLSITPEPPMLPAARRLHIFERLSIPLRDLNFRRLILFLSTWNFAVNLAAPFFTVYMLRSLGYPMTVIVVLFTISQLANVAALNLWGPLIDRFSNKAVLDMSAPLFLACMLAWTFTGLPYVKPVVLYLLVLIHLLMGFSTAGVALASTNLAMTLAPREEAIGYLAINSVVPAVFAAIAPILGGLTADFFATHRLTLSFTWAGRADQVTLQVLNFHDWTFFFAIAFFIGLYSLHRLSRIEEKPGTTDPLLVRDLLLEARRSIHSLSSAAGLVRIVRIPISSLFRARLRRLYLPKRSTRAVDTTR
jgi:MFS family permease